MRNGDYAGRQPGGQPHAQGMAARDRQGARPITCTLRCLSFTRRVQEGKSFPDGITDDN